MLRPPPSSLVALRVVLGAGTAIDLASRLCDVKALYSDDGVLPRAVVVEEHVHPLHISLCLATGKWQAQAVFLLTGVVAGLMLALGWHTRAANAVSWVVVCSVQLRNPLVLHHGDSVLRLLLGWALLCDLHACGMGVDAAVHVFRQSRDAFVRAVVLGMPVTHPSPAPSAACYGGARPGSVLGAVGWVGVGVQCALVHVVQWASMAGSEQWWSGQSTQAALLNPTLFAAPPGTAEALLPLARTIVRSQLWVQGAGLALVGVGLAAGAVGVGGRAGRWCQACGVCALAAVYAGNAWYWQLGARATALWQLVALVPLVPWSHFARPAARPRHNAVVWVHLPKGHSSTNRPPKGEPAASLVLTHGDVVRFGVHKWHEGAQHALRMWDDVRSIVWFVCMLQGTDTRPSLGLHVVAGEVEAEGRGENDTTGKDSKGSADGTPRPGAVLKKRNPPPSAVHPASPTAPSAAPAPRPQPFSVGFGVVDEGGHAVPRRLVYSVLLTHCPRLFSPLMRAMVLVTRRPREEVPRDLDPRSLAPPASSCPGPRSVVFGLVADAALVVLGVVCLAYVVLLNTSSLDTAPPALRALSPTLQGHGGGAVAGACSVLFRTLFLEQQWALWCPHPPLDFGWFVMPFRLPTPSPRRLHGFGVGAGGDTLGGDFDGWAFFAKSSHDDATRVWSETFAPQLGEITIDEDDPWHGLEWWNPYPAHLNTRWSTYMRALWVSLNSPDPPRLTVQAFAEFLCDWIAEHAGVAVEVEAMDVQFMLHAIEGLGGAGDLRVGDVEAVYAWTHKCSEHIADSYFIKARVQK